jgi:hypothetical protein
MRGAASLILPLTVAAILFVVSRFHWRPAPNEEGRRPLSWIVRREVIGEPLVAPDSASFVYLVKIERRYVTSPPRGLPSLPLPRIPTRYEFYSYDLVRRSGPRRVVAWESVERHRGGLLSYDGRIAVVRSHDNTTIEDDSIDVSTGVRRSYPRDHATTNPWASAPENWRSPHVIEENRLFFLRGAAPRKDQFLFEMPTAAGGDSMDGLENLDQDRRRRAHLTALRQIVALERRDGPRGVMIVVKTYAPRPDSVTRRFRVWYTLGLPDTSEGASAGNGDRLLRQRDLTLGPADGDFFESFKYSDLNRMVTPHRRPSLNIDPWASWFAPIGVKMAPLTPTGEVEAETIVSSASVGIEIPPVPAHRRPLK